MSALEEHGERIRQIIGDKYWPRLVRQLTLERAEEAIFDSKTRKSLKATIFLPPSAKHDGQLEYYSRSSTLDVVMLRHADEYDASYLQKIAGHQGILAAHFANGQPTPYVVPGGRFNEFYGWDSYFISLGLLQEGKFELASYAADHFSYEIENYGKILNANRPYFLGRSQPPFLTDLAWRLHDYAASHNGVELDKQRFIGWMNSAIKEYRTVWAAKPRYDHATKLFRYSGEGRKMPPEVERGHFDDVFCGFATSEEIPIRDYIKKYNTDQIEQPVLDEFFAQDRAVRESGHDVTTRFFDLAASLVTIDLASLVFKYETDIARAVAQYPQYFPQEDAGWWRERAAQTQAQASKYLWSDKLGAFCDYNVAKRERNEFPSATMFWSLWSGLATAQQAAGVREHGLTVLEFPGGLASTSELPDVGRQWDYPAGWAPHQILAWEGLERYGYADDAKRLALKWLNTVAEGAQQTSHALYEKYDVRGVPSPQDLRAEYGNQGNAETGFGWTNSSFAIGWDRYVKQQ